MTRDALRRYFFAFEVPASKVNLVRIAFFSVLAVDAFLMLGHAPRYGAGGFNVSHFPWLDPWLPLPNRRVMVVLFLCEAYLAARIVFGAAIDHSVRLLTALYAYTYFCSQADAYQHHYLVFLLLVLSCFVPWDRARDMAREIRQSGGEAEEPRVTSWALRLVTVQLALVYLWAAIAKVDPVWLDGTALKAQIGTESARWLVDGLGAVLPGTEGGYPVLAWSALLGELFLAAAVLRRRLWPAAWLVGMTFHLGIALLGLEIGLFTWFLVGLYLVFLPDRLVTRAAGWWRSRIRSPGSALGDRLPGATGLPGLSLGIAAGIAALWHLPFEGSRTAAGIIAVLGLLAALASRRYLLDAPGRPAAAHLFACLALLGLHLVTDQAFDYYRYLGGTSRRLGDPETMETAYRKLSEVRPEYGPAYLHLGALAEGEGDADGALALYRKAQEREPADPRPFEAEARIRFLRADEAGALAVLESCQRTVPDRADCFVAAAAVHARAGRREETRSAAARAVEIEPGNRAALSLLRWASASITR